MGAPVSPLAEALRGHRLAAGLTQEELAARSTLSPRTISDLERGVARTARGSSATLLADALGLEGPARAGFLTLARGAAAPVAPAPAVPVPARPLLGRDDLVAEVRDLLAGARWVTLTGMGGVGKTSLALEVARGRDALFVPLESVTDPAAVLPAVAHRLELRDAPGRDPAAALAAAFASRPTLLVLDNLEQVVDAAAEVAAVVGRCPGLTVLVTSRVPCRVRWERVVEVPPLPVPGPGEDALGNPAVRLLADRVRARDRSWQPAGDLAELTEISRLLDGHPLALELAAPRLPLLGAAGLTERLRRGPLALLTGGPRDAPERHRTLQRTLAWSHDLLGDSARTVLRRVAVFADGWTVEAAEAVCRRDGEDLDVLEAVAELLEASLLRRPGSTPGRLGMLQTVREDALARLAAAGEADEFRARHAAHYAELVTGASAGIIAGDRWWVDRLAGEHANVLAAVDGAVALGDTDRALTLVGEAAEYWFEAGHLAEGVRLLELALALPGGTPALRAYAAMQTGWLAFDLADQERARRRLLEARDLHPAGGDPVTLVLVLNGLGGVAHELGDPAEAEEHYRAGLRLAEELGLDERAAAIRVNLAGVLLEHDPVRALELSDRVLAEPGAPARTRGSAANTRGLALARLGRHEEALAAFREAAGLLHEAADRGRFLLGVLGNHAASLAALGDRTRAALLFGAADAHWDRSELTANRLDDLHRGVRDDLLAAGDPAVLAAFERGAAVPFEALPDLLA